MEDTQVIRSKLVVIYDALHGNLSESEHAQTCVLEIIAWLDQQESYSQTPVEMPEQNEHAALEEWAENSSILFRALQSRRFVREGAMALVLKFHELMAS